MIKNHIKFITSLTSLVKAVILFNNIDTFRVIKSSHFTRHCYYERWRLVRPQQVVINLLFVLFFATLEFLYSQSNKKVTKVYLCDSMVLKSKTKELFYEMS